MTRAMREEKDFGRISSDKLFPGKLHDMLDHVVWEGREDVICWTDDGRAFHINNTKDLAMLLPLFFGHSNYRSFHRQLNLWSFKRLVHGPNKSAFCHPFFLRGRKELCQTLNRERFRSTHIYAESTTIKTTKCSSLQQTSTDCNKIPSYISDGPELALTAEPSLDPFSLNDGDSVSFEERTFHFVGDDLDIFT